MQWGGEGRGGHAHTQIGVQLSQAATHLQGGAKGRDHAGGACS